MRYLGSAVFREGVHTAADGLLRALRRHGITLARLVTPAAQLDARHVTYTKLEEARTATVAAPVAAVADSDGSFQRRLQRVGSGYPVRDCGMLTIRNGRFHMPSGIVVQRRRFPAETIPLSDFPYAWQVADAIRTAAAPARGVADGYMLTLQLARNYYHWVAEILPLAFLIERHDPERLQPIYIGADLPSFVSEYLQILGLAGSVVPLRRGVYKAESLRVPTFPGGAEWPSPAHLAMVRRRVLDALSIEPRRRRRLYVSRRDALDRRVRNEDELLETLEPYGFETVLLGELSAEEQIRLFADAETVVSPHGAGLTNVLFASPETAVLELVGSSYVATCFLVITSTVGQRYGYAQCREDRRQLIVDVPSVRDLLDKLVSTGG